MTVMTSAGTTLAVSATLPASYDATGFAALTFTPVGEITDLGEFGVEYSLVTFTALGQRRQKKFKGSYNNGALQLQMGRDVADAGQAILIAAQHSDASYAFVVTLQDGSKEYFTGKVMSYKTGVGSVDQITAATTSIEIDNDVVSVAA